MPPIDTLKIDPRWLDILAERFRWRRCAQRVLVVTDGLSFGAGSFGLSTFLAELGKAYPTPVVTTHLASGDSLGVDYDNFDQVWLFGSSGAALEAAEITKLTDFMNAGRGGVFATGDHETLGLGLCGSIPRVRGMREWSAVPMSVERIDTVTHPGTDGAYRFTDQGDRFPQRIHPVFVGSGSTWAPHPLLRAARTIDVLPDHAHESVCYGGADTRQTADFPAGLRPEVVAWSVSAGRYLDDVDKPPTTPKLFGAVSAYDGHLAGQGRIVCDATWHHFVNVNLLGLQDPPGTFTDDFNQIAAYYRNILDWLTPPQRRWCRWWIDLVIARYATRLFEEYVPLPPHPCPWEPRLALGRRVEAALEAHAGTGAGWEIVTAALDAADLGRFAELVRPRSAADHEQRRDKDLTHLVPIGELRAGVIGSVFDALVAGLPPSPDQFDRAGDDGDHDDGSIERRAAEAARAAIDAAREHYTRAAKATLDLVG